MTDQAPGRALRELGEREDRREFVAIPLPPGIEAHEYNEAQDRIALEEMSERERVIEELLQRFCNLAAEYTHDGRVELTVHQLAAARAAIAQIAWNSEGYRLAITDQHLLDNVSAALSLVPDLAWESYVARRTAAEAQAVAAAQGPSSEDIERANVLVNNFLQRFRQEAVETPVLTSGQMHLVRMLCAQVAWNSDADRQPVHEEALYRQILQALADQETGHQVVEERDAAEAAARPAPFPGPISRRRLVCIYWKEAAALVDMATGEVLMNVDSYESISIPEDVPEVTFTDDDFDDPVQASWNDAIPMAARRLGLDQVAVPEERTLIQEQARQIQGHIDNARNELTRYMGHLDRIVMDLQNVAYPARIVNAQPLSPERTEELRRVIRGVSSNVQPIFSEPDPELARQVYEQFTERYQDVVAYGNAMAVPAAGAAPGASPVRLGMDPEFENQVAVLLDAEIREEIGMASPIPNEQQRLDIETDIRELRLRQIMMGDPRAIANPPGRPAAAAMATFLRNFLQTTPTGVAPARLRMTREEVTLEGRHYASYSREMAMLDQIVQGMERSHATSVDGQQLHRLVSLARTDPLTPVEILYERFRLSLNDPVPDEGEELVRPSVSVSQEFETVVNQGTVTAGLVGGIVGPNGRVTPRNEIVRSLRLAATARASYTRQELRAFLQEEPIPLQGDQANVLNHVVATLFDDDTVQLSSLIELLEALDQDVTEDDADWVFGGGLIDNLPPRIANGFVDRGWLSLAVHSWLPGSRRRVAVETLLMAMNAQTSTSGHTISLQAFYNNVRVVNVLERETRARMGQRGSTDGIILPYEWLEEAVELYERGSVQRDLLYYFVQMMVQSEDEDIALNQLEDEVYNILAIAPSSSRESILRATNTVQMLRELGIEVSPYVTRGGSLQRLERGTDFGTLQVPSAGTGNSGRRPLRIDRGRPRSQ